MRELVRTEKEYTNAHINDLVYANFKEETERKASPAYSKFSGKTFTSIKFSKDRAMGDRVRGIIFAVIASVFTGFLVLCFKKSRDYLLDHALAKKEVVWVKQENYSHHFVSINETFNKALFEGKFEASSDAKDIFKHIFYMKETCDILENTKAPNREEFIAKGLKLLANEINQVSFAEEPIEDLIKALDELTFLFSETKRNGQEKLEELEKLSKKMIDGLLKADLSDYSKDKEKVIKYIGIFGIPSLSPFNDAVNKSALEHLVKHLEKLSIDQLYPISKGLYVKYALEPYFSDQTKQGLDMEDILHDPTIHDSFKIALRNGKFETKPTSDEIIAFCEDALKARHPGNRDKTVRLVSDQIIQYSPEEININKATKTISSIEMLGYYNSQVILNHLYDLIQKAEIPASSDNEDIGRLVRRLMLSGLHKDKLKAAYNKLVSFLEATNLEKFCNLTHGLPVDSDPAGSKEADILNFFLNKDQPDYNKRSFLLLSGEDADLVFKQNLVKENFELKIDGEEIKNEHDRNKLIYLLIEKNINVKSFKKLFEILKLK